MNSSSSAMADSTEPVSGSRALPVTERLRAMRASNALNKQISSAEVSTGRKPDETTGVSILDSDLPIRDTELVSEENLNTLTQPLSRVLGASTPPGLPTIEFDFEAVKLGPREHIIPLKMHARLNEQYSNILLAATRDVNAFLQATDTVPPTLLEGMKTLVDEVNDFLKSPDLVTIPEGEDRGVPSSALAAWAASSSSKFDFLRSLLNELRDQPIHVCIALRAGRFTDTVSSFLDGYGYKFEIAGVNTKSASDTPMNPSSLFITLLPADKGDSRKLPPKSADVVIALDDSFPPTKSKSQVTQNQPMSIEPKQPVLHLIIANSPDHVSVSLSEDISEVQRLKSIIGISWKLMESIGETPYSILGLDSSFIYQVSAFIGDGSGMDWPLPGLPEVDHLEEFLGEDLPRLGSPSTSGSISESEQENVITSPKSLKRNLTDYDAESEPSYKRQRSTPAQEVDAASSNMASNHYQEAPGQVSHRSISEVLAQSNKSSIRSTRESSSTVKIKREEFEQLQSNLIDYAESTDALQGRFEKLSKDYKQAMKDLDHVRASQTLETEQVNALHQRLQRSEEERRLLKDELEVERTAAKRSEIPGVPEIAAAHETARAASALREKLEKQLQSAKQNLEYVQSQYQNASAAAAEAANEITELKEANETLAKKVDGEKQALRKMVLTTQGADDVNRIRELEAMLVEREEILRRKDEEIKGLKNRGLATRGTSVPRSPKLYHSRPTSPAPSTLGPNVGVGRASGVISSGHPLRNS